MYNQNIRIYKGLPQDINTMMVNCLFHGHAQTSNPPPPVFSPMSRVQDWIGNAKTDGILELKHHKL